MDLYFTDSLRVKHTVAKNVESEEDAIMKIMSHQATRFIFAADGIELMIRNEGKTFFANKNNLLSGYSLE